MDEAGKKRLWQDYRRLGSPEIREQLIVEYAPLVKIVAGRLSMYLGGNVEYDDLVSYGVFGLIDAIDRFDDLKDVKFETYASLRIRGSVLDQIRKMDWIPRTVRQRQKRIDDAIREIEAETGHQASDEEIRNKLGITEDELLNWQSQMKVTGVVSLDEFMEQGADVSGSQQIYNRSSFNDGPEEALEKKELKQMLKDSLENLTEKERNVVMLYYYEDMTLKEISQSMGVSESRVSQLHSKAIQKMRKILGDYIGLVTNRA
ncbi:MAG: FliA/WhiG family RNA polymerase sigma factor [Lachnospiraceae bacterium]|nr:FliA/WhiG family RNA polymerase sigma factor [Lachnospiraceae bacterium]